MIRGRSSQRRQFGTLKTLVLVVIGLLFLAWSGAFIYRASFVALDGRRYFSLFDDAMISMRYAWNLAHGNGLVWNPGQRIEGYTNLLMVLFMAIPNLILEKRIAAFAVQLFGVLLMICNGYLSMQIAALTSERINEKSDDLNQILVFGGTLAYYPLIFWSLMGMETGLLTFMGLLAALACIHYSRNARPGHLILAASAIGLAYLVRPDSIVLSIVLIGFTVINPPFERQQLKPMAIPLLPLLSGLAIFILAQQIFRLAYYQEAAPNTYVLKLGGMPLNSRLSDGLNFLRPFVESIIPASLLGVAGITAKPGRWMFMFVSIGAALLGYQIWTGGDPWPYWRIIAPAFPFMVIVLVRGSSRLATYQDRGSMGTIPIRITFVIFGLYFLLWPFVNSHPRLSQGIGPADLALSGLGAGAVITGLFPRNWPSSISRTRARIQTVALTAMALISLNLAFLPEMIFRVRPYTVDENIGMVNRAIAISEVTTPNASVGVFWAGAIPYYTGLPAVDFLGRSDRYIARLAPDLTGSTGWYGMRSVPGHNKYDLYYSIVSLAPTYIQGVRWGSQDLNKWAESAYVAVEHRGVLLRLRKNDPNVLWEKILPEE